ncbi:glycoside hydrolase family 63 protein [Heterobasidion irregulare TC 32-1]|uniref:Mannosyl-oligosaccharide glucosidase n=1 Tax=Heterobasidion irregulare (strain TC 32-1) TaxID=747525 RepID=W4KKD0_HETIT|nr:glycoside hydrolase family 63 protein [Heterobasidion irregulare TC 32-1]ETW85531.1 glycoside hydrolase family 63 protein [Heterobasidion irregulare TC 32-1]
MRLLWLLLPLAPSVFSKPANDTDSLLWGAYRPNLYFGLKPRIPQSLMTGLIWFGTQDYQSFTRSRHACDQGDELDGYTWTMYDARDGGVQVLKDSKNNVKVTTEFLKIPGDLPSRTSFIFYSGLEGLGGIDMETQEAENGIEGPIEFSGSTPELDEFTIRIEDDPKNAAFNGGPFADVFKDRIGKTHYGGFRVPQDNMWQAKEVIIQDILQRARDALAPYQNPAGGAPDPSFILQLNDEALSNSNLFAVQKLFDGEFQFDVFFESKSAKQKLNAATLDEGMQAFTSSFNERFQSVFPVPPSPKKESIESFSKAITSNLIGGVGYFYGKSIVDKSFAYEWDEDDSFSAEGDAEDSKDKGDGGAHLTEPKALLTATPSRSFFPRGFYWDEGFHLMHIGEWDNDLSLEILKDWINLIDEDGWVAREQILGEEARSKVPPEFQTQVPSFANPPTLAMAVTAFIGRLKATGGPSDKDLGIDFGMADTQIPLSSPRVAGSRYLEDPELALSYLKSIYKPLKRHYDWFRRTQRGQLKQYSRKARSRTEAYRWRGRSEQHVLTSGMDDYPRGPPHAGELHLDLISWMGFFSRTMKEIAEFVGEEEDASYFDEVANAVIGNIDDLHWNKEEKMYCDVNVNDDDESYHVCHRGYLSLFPFLLSLVSPDSPHLGAILDLLRDPEHLWSPYGLRSLSASHPDFGQGENYWKGPIWIQMNYLALRALHKTYAAQEGPYQDTAKKVYSELRHNIVDNVHKEYERTGYVWEQYDAKTGEGRRSHPFTGWTSLVTLIISEKY